MLLGVSVHPGGLGLQPVASLQAYRVGFPEGADGVSGTWAVGPAVGLRYRLSPGYIEGKVGYSFRSDEGDFPFFGGGESGVTSSAHGEYWGDGSVALQGIASYNWGSEFLWSRARGTLRVASFDAGSVDAGAEATWQKEFLGDEVDVPGFEVEGYQATMVGPVVRFLSNRGWMGVLGAGWKDDNFGDESTWYFKAELVVSPRL